MEVALTEARFQTFAQFFLFYLTEHRSPSCRALHYIGSTLAVANLALALALLNPWLLLTIPLVSYPFSWIGHFFIEKNVPATFKYPLWSLVADYRMMYLELTGQLARVMPDDAVAP